MEYKSPAYQVIPVPIGKIKPNTYNPNAVAPPEMALLYESIKADGYTMPVVCYYDERTTSISSWTDSTVTAPCWTIRISMRESRGCSRYP